MMSQVWELKLPAKDKLVLLAIADCANDEGLAWPSIATLSRKCGCDPRTIQRHLRALETAKLIETEEIVGKGNRYIVTPRQVATPGKKSPVTKSTETPGKLPPKPSRTIKNGLANAKPMRAIIARPDDVSEAVWRDYNRQRRKPLTDTALRGLKREADKAGWTLESALEEATTRGWESFKADWVKDKGNGNGIRQGGGTGPDKRSGLARAIDSELERISAFP